MNEFTKRLIFNEDNHAYIVDGVSLPSVTELCGPLTYSKYRVDNAVIDQAAYRGSLIHELTALYDRGDLEPDETVAADVGLYLMAWISFCHDYQPRFEYIELPLACSYMAGTVDRVCVIDGVRTILDIKTTSSLDRANKVALAIQTYGYSLLCAENDIPVNYSKALGVQLKKDGTYTIYWVKQIIDKYKFCPSSLFGDLRAMHDIVKGVKRCQVN